MAPGVELESATPAARPRPQPGVPVRLVVPSLGVDAPVIPITAPGGVLLPPGDPQTLGWWRDGAQPGAETGGALITGHTVHTGGGAFDDLDTMRTGQRVSVRTPRGLLEYAVSSVTVYRKSTLARDAERIFSQTVPGPAGADHLRGLERHRLRLERRGGRRPGVTDPRGYAERDQRSLSVIGAG